MNHQYKDILFEKADGVATLTLNRPERLNALSPGIRQGVIDAVAEAAADDSVKVLILTGAGRSFCSGADLRAMDQIRAAEGRIGILGPLGLPVLRLHTFEKPTIAAVNGPAYGGGFGLTLACDIRIASDKAKFCSMFIRRAFAVNWGVSYFLPRLIGMSKALQIMWSGDIVEAKEAEKLGIVDRVVPHDDLMNICREMALRLAKGPSVSIELIKRLAYAGMNNTLAVQLGYEMYGSWVTERTEDRKEGVRAFLERREPVFKGL